ncbi:MAG: DUF2911 domain-containing protein [Acidobacteriota bacterium]|nr:DUF2911 domain-containing protein [Acidobacteriota bacterium]
MGSRAYKKISTGIFALILLATAFALGHGNDHGHAHVTLANGEVSVEYHRPLAKGRDLLSMVQPGLYWRMGADGPTTLNTEVDLLFGDTTVPKGEYVLWAHFEDSERWSLVLATAPSRRQPDPDTILVSRPGSISKNTEAVEQLTIELTTENNTGILVLEWGTARLSVNFTTA